MSEKEKEVKQYSEEELKELVVNRLKTVYDPEIPVNIYDLGLIYEISIFPVNKVYIRMTLTSPNCPVAGEMPTMTEEAVKNIEGVSEVNVELTFDPPYHQDMMSEEAKLELGFL